MLRSRILLSFFIFTFVAFMSHQGNAQQQGGMGGGMMGGHMMGGGMGRGHMMGHGGMMGGGCPMVGMMMDADMSTFGQGRTAFIKAELAITDAQKGVWDAYASAIQHNFESMTAARKTMMAAMDGKTPVERLDAHTTAMEGRVKALKEIKPALTALYEALTADQRKKADEVLTGMACMM
jgi:hypothetical protein